MGKNKNVAITLLCLLLIIILSVASVGCRKKETLEPPRLEPPPLEELPRVETPPQIQAGPTYQVKLYFLSGNKLAPETREIPKVIGLARATIEELIKGPSPGSDLTAVIPFGTQLLDINIKQDGLCIVNFSQEILEADVDPQEEALIVYSIVNTLTEFATVNKVQIWVEGKVVNSLAGHVNISGPLSRNERYIK